MKRLLKIIANKLPKRYQQEFKRVYFRRQIASDSFVSDEKEFERLQNWVSEGDWVIDVGANIGHYTKKLSELVSSTGRVIAFEPVPDTFELLAANMACLPSNNITLINAAASNTATIHGMALPKFDTGLDNYYRANITTTNPSLEILCLSIDALNLPCPIKLVKIDAEGHDLSVLKGMESTLKKDCPILIVEDGSTEIDEFLEDLGYSSERIDGSHNKVFKACIN
jgi:FkbM family methyltransferase